MGYQRSFYPDELDLRCDQCAFTIRVSNVPYAARTSMDTRLSEYGFTLVDTLHGGQLVTQMWCLQCQRDASKVAASLADDGPLVTDMCQCGHIRGIHRDAMRWLHCGRGGCKCREFKRDVRFGDL